MVWCFPLTTGKKEFQNTEINKDYKRNKFGGRNEQFYSGYVTFEKSDIHPSEDDECTVSYKQRFTG